MRSHPLQLRRVLSELRTRGDRIPVRDLARRLLATSEDIALPLARRLVATALEFRPEDVPVELQGDDLRVAEERAVAGISLARATFAVVDLETTGLSARESEILEIGAVRVTALELAGTFQSLARPLRTIPRRITSITGIDDAAVAEAPPLPEVLTAFQSWMADAPRAPFVAHNARFDAGFVGQALDRHELPPLAVPVLCTLRLARRLAPEVGRYSLDHLCAHFGVSNSSRHRALGDARAAARVLVEILARAPDLGVRSIGDLLDLQERRSARR